MKKILVISISLLFLTSCQVAQSIDKGLYSVADAVSSRDTITGARTLNIAGRQKQISQGNNAASSILAKYEKENKKIDSELDSSQYKRLKRIFNRLHKASHMRDESWSVHLIPEDSFNAFVTGGTMVVVHQGLMKQLKSDAEVASVIGHEMAHVSANHVFERQASGIANAVAKSNSGSSGFVQAAYSRLDEKEADKVGVLYTALAGYNPVAAVKVWEDIYKKKGTHGQIASTHPMSSERISNNSKYASQVKQYYMAGKTNPKSADILENNVLFQKKAATSSAGSGGGLAAIFETAANFYVNKGRAQQEAGIAAQRIAMLQDIQKNIKVGQTGKAKNGDLVIQMQYLGRYRVQNLAIMAVTQTGSSIYRTNKLVNPRESFVATFDPSIVKSSGAKTQLKLVVDEGKYIR